MLLLVGVAGFIFKQAEALVWYCPTVAEGPSWRATTRGHHDSPQRPGPLTVPLVSLGLGCFLSVPLTPSCAVTLGLTEAPQTHTMGPGFTAPGALDSALDDSALWPSGQPLG